jgi:YgiT-type zinc finger domain-containing protein
MYIALSNPEDVPEKCPNCAAEKTLSLHWLDQTFNPLPEHEMTTNAPVYSCTACGEVMPDIRVALMQQVAQVWVSHAKMRTVSPYITVH